MNALTASTLVAVISAIALAIVALITARSRIGILPKKAEHNLSGTPGIQIDLPESAAKFRVLGWLVVVTMYLIAAFCLLQGINALRISRDWDKWQASFGSLLAERTEIELYAIFWIVTAIALVLIAYWAQSRLKRRSP
jgi:hypothetical protein